MEPHPWKQETARSASGSSFRRSVMATPGLSHLHTDVAPEATSQHQSGLPRSLGTIHPFSILFHPKGQR